MNTYFTFDRVDIERMAKGVPLRFKTRLALQKALEAMDKDIDQLQLIGPDEEELHGDDET